MDWLNEILTDISGFLWGWPMIILLLGTHIFLTVRLKFPQRHILKAIRLSVQRDPDARGDVSQFGSLATALAATIGTGNIIGVATAIALGGPGAVLWCWLTGVFGISTKYAEGLLARPTTDECSVVRCTHWNEDWAGNGSQCFSPCSRHWRPSVSAIQYRLMPSQR